MTHLLITRPEPDAQDLKTRLETLGCQVSLAPLLDIIFEDIAVEAVAGAAALIATSRNGVRALANSPAKSAALSLPIFAVGPATAATAQELGFRDIRAGAGTAADLVPLVAALAPAERRPVVHLAGDHLAFDLAAALKAHGIVINSVAAYRSVAVNQFTPDIAAAVRQNQIDGVILMSPRTAQIWSACLTALRSPAGATALVHICLSDAVARALSPTPEKIAVADRPNLEEILNLVKRLAAVSKPE